MRSLLLIALCLLVGASTAQLPLFDPASLAAARPSTPAVPDITNNLAGWWLMRDVIGTTAHDSSTNSNDGTLVNGPVLDGGALWFTNSAKQKITLPANASLQIETFTIAAWVYSVGTVDGNHNKPIMGRNPGVDNLPELRINENDKLQFLKQAAVLIGTSSGSVSVNNWHHVALVNDRATGDFTFYIDGSAAGSGSVAIGFSAVSGQAIGGAYDDGSVLEYFNGGLKDVRFYNVVLSSGDIATLNTNGPR